MDKCDLCIVCEKHKLYTDSNKFETYDCGIDPESKNKCKEYMCVFQKHGHNILEFTKILYWICQEKELNINSCIKNTPNYIRLLNKFEGEIKHLCGEEAIPFFMYDMPNEQFSEYFIKVIQESDISIVFVCYLILQAIDKIIFSSFFEEYYEKNNLLDEEFIEKIVNDINEKKSVLFLQPQNKIKKHFSQKEISDGKKISIPNHAENASIKYKLNYYLNPQDVSSYRIRYTKLCKNLIDNQNNFRITISPLGFKATDFLFNIEEVCGKQYFQVSEEINNLGYYEEEIIKFIEHSLENQSNIIAFPELTIPPKVFAKIKDKLDSYRAKHDFIMIAGSYHEIIEDEMRNCARIISNFKFETLQYKMTPYENKEDGSKDIKEVTEETKYFKDKGYSFLRSGAEENIECSPRELKIIDSNDFRMAVVICNDFIGEDVIKMLKEYSVNLIVVCSWHDSLEPKFFRSCQQLAEYNGATTVISNHCVTNKRVPIGVINFPIKKSSNTDIIPDVILKSCGNNEEKACQQFCSKTININEVALKRV